MEVHHHSHTPDPDPTTSSGHRGRKKWTHYFWEFLMLFLAVFCGFLAEYQLEHTIEKQREKQYLQSFIYDLQNDTSLLNEGFLLKDQRVKAINNVFQFFEKNPDADIIPGVIYRDIRRTSWDRHYRRNSTTIDQLKNAGGMRLIRKRNVRDSIAAYDLRWLRAEFWRETYMSNQERSLQLVSKLVNAKDLVSAYRTNPMLGNLPAHITDSLTVRINTKELNEYLNFLHDQKGFTRQDKVFFEGIKQSAGRLIELIRKEYHIK